MDRQRHTEAWEWANMYGRNDVIEYVLQRCSKTVEMLPLDTAVVPVRVCLLVFVCMWQRVCDVVLVFSVWRISSWSISKRLTPILFSKPIITSTCCLYAFHMLSRHIDLTPLHGLRNGSLTLWYSFMICVFAFRLHSKIFFSHDNLIFFRK